MATGWKPSAAYIRFGVSRASAAMTTGPPPGGAPPPLPPPAHPLPRCEFRPRPAVHVRHPVAHGRRLDPPREHQLLDDGGLDTAGDLLRVLAQVDLVQR